MASSVDNAEQRFLAVVNTELDAMYRVALRMLRDRDNAEDAVQDVLNKAWRKVKRQEAGLNMKPWIMKILVNTCLDQIRARKRQNAVPFEPDDPELQDYHSGQRLPDAELSNKQLGLLIDSEISRLSAEYQLVVQLVIVEQLSYEEAAAALDVPIGTVRSRLSRARAQLSDALSKSLEGNDNDGGDGSPSHLKLVK